MAAPDVVLVGCTVNTSRAAEPGVIVNALLAAAVTLPPEAARVYPAPTLSMLRPANVATPFTAATVTVPESVPPLGLVPSATVKFAVNVGSVFPSPSCATTCTAGVIGAPAPVLVGGIVDASC